VTLVLKGLRLLRTAPTPHDLQFPLPNGRTVPLGVFAVLDFEQEFPLIWRREGIPTLTVQADVAQGVSPEAVVNALAPAVAKLEASVPKSYHIAVGGTVEESARSQASVYAVIPLMLFIAITLLMMQLQSFSLLFLVLSVVPMGLIGVVATLPAHQHVSSPVSAWVIATNEGLMIARHSRTLVA
jgi:multidrug efflux pump subunit AcrB